MNIISNKFCNPCIDFGIINKPILNINFEVELKCLDVPFNIIDKNCGIYKITNPKGYIYIGQAKNFIKREKKYRVLDNVKRQIRLYRSIKKYGWESHTFEKIHICMPDELNDLETYYIKLYDSFDTPHGMNLQSGGHKNVNFSVETLKKMSESAKNKPPVSDETRKKLSEKGKKRIMTLEAKEKISRANTGNTKSEEERKLISERTKEAMKRPEVRKKFLEGNKNKVPVSDATRKKMSEASKGRSKGRIHTEQSRKNMSEGKRKKKEERKRLLGGENV